MIAWLAAVFCVAGFLALGQTLRLIPISLHALFLVGESLSIMGDRRLDDAERERGLRRLSGRLTFGAANLIGRMALALALPVALVWFADKVAWLDFSDVARVALSPTFVVLSSLVLLASMAYLPGASQPNPAHSYSLGDQLLHKTAFATTSLQLLVSRLEDRLWRRTLLKHDADRPVFITALPRAGTTLLVECCARTGELAAHRYRLMPFLLAPLLWWKASRWFQKRGEKRERAHGDGMLIDFDSPEALEEMFWLAHFRRPYASDRILPFRQLPLDETFGDRFRRHMRKIIDVCAAAGARPHRYVSKNNLNIARLSLLRGLFPSCSIVVPFRHPLQHCYSLLSQHRRFTKLQAEDPFVSEYMRQVGHFDFGENLRPIDFDGWLDRSQSRDPNTLGFWLEYWLAAYGHILENHRGHVILVDYDELCREPSRVLHQLGRSIDLRSPEALFTSGMEIRAPREHAVPVGADLQPLVDSALNLWSRLQTASHDEVDRAAAAARGKATAALDTRLRVRTAHTPERLVTLGFGAALLLTTGFLIGYHSVLYKTLPFRITSEALAGAEQLYDIVTDDGLPHDFLQPARGAGAGVTVGSGLKDGKLILVSSFYEGGNQIRLMRRDGSIVARWPLSWSAVFGELKINRQRPQTDWNVDVHGMRIHPNGDVVFNFEYFGTVRLSRCGALRWRVEHPTHHSLVFAEQGGYWVPGRERIARGDGRLWPFLGPVQADLLLRISNDGHIVQRISVPEAMINSGLGYLFTSAGPEFLAESRSRYEVLHVNKVEELTTEMSAHFPQFEPGDLLISARDLNLLLVIDPDTQRVKWHQTGPYLLQHDPVFRADGTISVFNNNLFKFQKDASPRLAAARASNVLSVNPATHATRVAYGGREDQYLLTTIRGKQQPLEGGGFLITEFEGGRVVEVDGSGRKVWEYINRYDERYVAEITEGRLIEADYFSVKDWTCRGVE